MNIVLKGFWYPALYPDWYPMLLLESSLSSAFWNVLSYSVIRAYSVSDFEECTTLFHYFSLLCYLELQSRPRAYVASSLEALVVVCFYFQHSGSGILLCLLSFLWVCPYICFLVPILSCFPSCVFTLLFSVAFFIFALNSSWIAFLHSALNFAGFSSIISAGIPSFCRYWLFFVFHVLFLSVEDDL